MSQTDAAIDGERGGGQCPATTQRALLLHYSHCNKLLQALMTHLGARRTGP